LSANLEKVGNHGLCITGYATHQDVDDLVLLAINKTKIRLFFGLPSKQDLNLERYSDEATGLWSSLAIMNLL